MTVITQITGAASGVSLAVAYLLAESAYNPEPMYLEVVQAKYVQIDGVGHILQQVDSSTGDPIPAIWTASITRRDENGVSQLLCSGTGGPDQPGNYAGDIDIYSLDEWTGDDCPFDTMSEQDFAEVSWTYTDENGLSITIGTTIRPSEDSPDA